LRDRSLTRLDLSQSRSNLLVPAALAFHLRRLPREGLVAPFDLPLPLGQRVAKLP